MSKIFGCEIYIDLLRLFQQKKLSELFKTHNFWNGWSWDWFQIWCCFFKGDVHSLDLQKPLANGFQDSKSGWKNSCVDGNGLSAPNGLLDGAPDPGMSWDPNLCSKIGAKSYQCSKKLCNLASKTDLWALWHIIAMFKDTVTLST